MELTQIKTGIFGYSKKSVCQYIAEQNELNAAELNKQKEVVYMSEVEQILAQQIGETLSTKDKMIRDIDEIMKKLAGISYEATAENKDRLKQAIKQNLAKTYSDEKLIAKTVEAYFSNIITPKADK